jgi:ribosome biogenesis protein ENP2
MNPLVSDAEEHTTLDFNPNMNMLATGCIDGTVEFWNLSTRSSVMKIPIPNHKSFEKFELCEPTALKFSNDGLNIAIGN